MVEKNKDIPKKDAKLRKMTYKRRQPPEKFITHAEAEAMLGNKMLYKYVQQKLIEKYTPAGYAYGYYRLADVERMRKFLAGEAPITEEETNEITFSRATTDDMEGIYNVAIELFPGGTTSAEARKPLVAVCADGNYIVRDKGEIVAYIHIQPLKPEVLKLFLMGRIRGKDIKAQHIEPFTTGKSVDVLIKSIGATRKNGEDQSLRYTRKLLFGVARELEKMGRQGFIIRKIYATSETITGIAMANSAGMKQLRTLEKPHDGTPGRYAYELDVDSSDLQILLPYKKALAEWHRTYSTQD